MGISNVRPKTQNTVLLGSCRLHSVFGQLFARFQDSRMKIGFGIGENMGVCLKFTNCPSHFSSARPKS